MLSRMTFELLSLLPQPANFWDYMGLYHVSCVIYCWGWNRGFVLLSKQELY